MGNIHKLIGNDLSNLIKEKGISEYEIYRKQEICSQPTLKNILKGKKSSKINFEVICDIYRFLNKKEILLKTDNIFINIKL